jgi:hypothetical protein
MHNVYKQSTPCPAFSESNIKNIILAKNNSLNISTNLSVSLTPIKIESSKKRARRSSTRNSFQNALNKSKSKIKALNILDSEDSINNENINIETSDDELINKSNKKKRKFERRSPATRVNIVINKNQIPKGCTQEDYELFNHVQKIIINKSKYNVSIKNKDSLEKSDDNNNYKNNEINNNNNNSKTNAKNKSLPITNIPTVLIDNINKIRSESTRLPEFITFGNYIKLN